MYLINEYDDVDDDEIHLPLAWLAGGGIDRNTE